MDSFKAQVQSLSLEEKIGQMIGLAFHGTTYNDELRMQVEEIKVGLIIYFKDNIQNPQQVFELNKTILEKAKIPPFIALDQEGGMVARVTEGIVQSPGAMAIGATHKPQYAYQLAYNMGCELRALGFNFNFAPVGDINNNSQNPVINVRSYSENPEEVAEFVVSATRGYHDAKLMTSIKHFPGHGDTNVDSHIGLPKVDFDEKRLFEVELKPFLKAKEFNLPGIMASHVMFTKYDEEFPTTLSQKVITGLLRERIGYDGLVVTDSLTMQAVWSHYTLEEIVLYGFNSGCDILLLCGARDMAMQKRFYELALNYAKSGQIPMKVIDKAVERILRYKAMYQVRAIATSFDSVKPKLLDPQAVSFSEKVSLKSISLIQDPHGCLPIKPHEKALIVFPKIKVVTLVEDPVSGLSSLHDYMKDCSDKFYISLSPTSEEIKTLKTLVEKYEKIVYCSYNARLNEGQAEVIKQIDVKKLVVASLRTPYDLQVLHPDTTYLCAYEATPLSFKSLAKILTGKEKPTGKIPVSI